MAYVEPNSKLQLFKGINLDNRYMHTIYFPDTESQTDWFDDKADITNLKFDKMMYRRYTSNSVKVQIDATRLFGVSYMRFMNDRAVDKWFYAFVLYIDYVNENTAIIYYEIDVMQTWFIQNGSIRPCMVLREHASTDNFGDNLEVEPIGSDVYDCDGDNVFSFDEFGSYSIVAQTTGVSDTGDRMTQGLFNGSKIRIFPCNTSGQADSIYASIQSMLGSWSIQEQEEDVVNLYTVPSWLIRYDEDYEVDYEAINELSSGENIQRPTTYDNYTPKNNKLFMYPFSYLLCTTHTGDVAIYRWEYFDGAIAEFQCIGTFLGGGEIWCYPNSYNGKPHDIDSGLIMNNFPKNAFAYDAYQAWIASGGTTRLENERVIASVHGAGGIMNIAGSLINSITAQNNTIGTTPVSSQVNQQSNQQHSSKSVTGAVSAIGGALNTAGSLIEAKNNLQYEFNDAVYHPNIVATKPTCNLAVASREANFYFYHCHVRDSEAKRIDDFFSCYGYATNKVKTPNLTGRAYWNFVMTKDAVIAGNMPASSKEAIGRIFDTGITFWHDGDNVGNYAIDTSNGSINNPISA